MRETQVRNELLQLLKNSEPRPPLLGRTWHRFFDFASVTNNPRSFYDPHTEGRFASLGAWSEAKAALLVSLGRELLPGRASEQDLALVEDGRQSPDSLGALGLAIHSGTTRSIQRALVVALDKARKCTGSRHPTLLATDYEYPGIITAIDEIWDGPVFFARLKEGLASESGNIPALFARAVKLVRPDVIYISHVDRYTGFVFPWDVLSEIAGKDDAPPIVVIDGAQAAGNIDLRPHLLLRQKEGPHLYATSAHKFLCAQPTLGLLIALRSDVREWDLDDKAVAYSLGQGSRGTGSIESMASLARSLRHVLSDSFSTRDIFLRELADGWTVVQHQKEHQSGLFRISTDRHTVALRIERLLRRKAGNVGYWISPSSEEECFLIRGIRRREERVFLNIENGHWRIEDDWRSDVERMTNSPQSTDSAHAEVRALPRQPATYRVSIHPQLHREEDVKRFRAFLNDPQSWRDRDFTSFENLLAARLAEHEKPWRKFVARNVALLGLERFPGGPSGASYHATCDDLIKREKGKSSRDREWGEGGIANTYYVLRGLRPYIDVKPLESRLAEHWLRRMGSWGCLGVRSSRGDVHERPRHACFGYLACLESEEHVEDSPLRAVKERQDKAIREWLKITANPERDTDEDDDWPFGRLCVLHRVLRDLDPESRAEDLVMERLVNQLESGAKLLQPNARTPLQLGPIFLSSAHAFSTLVDGRILDREDGRNARIGQAIENLCNHVVRLTRPHPRFTFDGPVSMTAALASLSFFMWPWLGDIWKGNPPQHLLDAVDDLIKWIETNWEDEAAYNHYWSEFHGSFLALDVVRASQIRIGEHREDDSSNGTAKRLLIAKIRTQCENGRPSDAASFDPLTHPLIFAPS
jgi:hypothetical protein